MKNTIPQKIPVLFSRPKKIPASFIDPQKIPFGQNVRPKKIIQTPPSLKYVSGAPGEKIKQLTMEIERLSAKNNSFQAEVFSIDRFITSDKDLFYFTRFPNASVLESILRYLNPGKAR